MKILQEQLNESMNATQVDKYMAIWLREMSLYVGVLFCVCGVVAEYPYQMALKTNKQTENN